MILSIGLIVKNEEKYIEQCLQGLMPIINAIPSELIIVDTGSTDRTIEIARKFTTHVYEHRWTNDFAEMRNLVLSYCKGEWFFFVDGDEILQDATGVINFFKKEKHHQYNSAFMQMKNILKSDKNEISVFQAIRFFKNDKDFYFEGAIHEQPRMKGPTAEIDGEILHYGYVNDDDELMAYKFERNVEILKKELEMNPDNIYYQYQLSQSYGMYNMHKESLEPARRAYELAEKKGLVNYLYAGERLCMVFWRNGLFTEAEALCRKMLTFKDANIIDLHFILAGVLLDLGKFPESITAFKQYLSLIKRFKAGKFKLRASINTMSMYKEDEARAKLCSIYNKMGQEQQALGYGTIIQEPKVAKSVMGIIVNIYTKRQKFSKIRDLFNKWKNENSVLKALETALESKWIDGDQVFRKEIIALLSKLNTTYGNLYLCRLNYYEKREISQDIWTEIEKESLLDAPTYYAEFIFALVRHGKPIYNKLFELRDAKISTFALYLSQLYDDSGYLFLDYLEEDKHWSDHLVADSHRIKANLAYGFLLNGKLDEKLYREFFQIYLNGGILFLEANYQIDVLDNARIAWMRTATDAFLLYMRLAHAVPTDSAEHVRYLRLALKQDKNMKRGVNILLEKVKENLGNPEQDKMKELQLSAQNAIKENINTGELSLAITLINEYERVFGLDAPVYSAKGIIHLIDGQIAEAESVFLEGLKLDPSNADLLYNLGYLAEEQGHSREAFDYYSKALEHTEDLVFENEILDSLMRLRSSIYIVKGGQESKLENISSLVDEQLLILKKSLARGRK